MTSPWTPAAVEMLKQLWADGKTAGQIAQQIGGVSRNAVLGKAHRLGLEPRVSPVFYEERRPGPGDVQIAVELSTEKKGKADA